MQLSKYIAVGLLLFSVWSFAQKKISSEVTAVYKHSFKTDKKGSSSKDYTAEEYTLFANKNEALFLSAKTLLRDSLLAGATTIHDNHKKKLNAEAGYSIYYKTAKPEVLFSQSLAGQVVQYAETPVLQWNLEPETKEIEGISCRMATAELYGRKWVAWYAPDLAFPFGPYKFQGLPGLILEISDASASYVFSLSSLKLEKREIKTNFNPDLKALSKTEFLKLSKKEGVKEDNPLELLP